VKNNKGKTKRKMNSNTQYLFMSLEW